MDNDLMTGEHVQGPDGGIWCIEAIADDWDAVILAKPWTRREAVLVSSDMIGAPIPGMPYKRFPADAQPLYDVEWT